MNSVIVITPEELKEMISSAVKACIDDVITSPLTEDRQARALFDGKEIVNLADIKKAVGWTRTTVLHYVAAGELIDRSYTSAYQFLALDVFRLIRKSPEQLLNQPLPSRKARLAALKA